MTKAQYIEANPHDLIHEKGTSYSRAESFEALPASAPVWVFHATDRATADVLLRDGVVQKAKPWTLARERFAAGESARFQPGSGLGEGLYVGASPLSVSGYGRRILAIRVRKKDIAVPPEGQMLKKTPSLALTDSDAVVLRDVVSCDVMDVTSGDGNRTWEVKRGHEAFVRRAVFECRPVPARVLADYPEITPPKSCKPHKV